MIRIAVIAACMALSVPALGQSQNAAQTGVGEAIESLQDLQDAFSEQWAGPPGQVFKGAVGLAGVAAALAAAQDAVTFKVRVQGDGSVDSGGSTTTTTATSVDSTSSTSSSTSTN